MPPDYALRAAREPMPPPPATSISAVTGPPTPYARQEPQLLPPSYQPPPLQIVPPGSAPGAFVTPPTPTESRLRSLESSVRHLSSVPQSLAALHATLANLQRSHELLLASLGPTATRPARELIDVPEAVWENYRTRAWPLTPWLAGLRESVGLPGLVVSWLGKRSVVDRDTRRECDDIAKEVRKEVGRLLSEASEWAKEEVHALGVYAYVV